MGKNINVKPIVFQIVWPFLYILLAAYIFTIYYFFSSSSLKTILIYLFWIGILLNIVWIFIYFRYNMFKTAYTLLITMILLGIFIVIKTFYLDGHKAIRILMAFFYLIYTLWLCFALFLLTYNN